MELDNLIDDMSLKWEQVEKALRCISGDKVLCKECAYKDCIGMTCHRVAARDAIRLINEYTKENKNQLVVKIVIPDEALEKIKNELLENHENA